MSAPVASPVRSVREQIADQLRNEILADRFPENEPLRESAIAERFGTSRGPIRDVFLQLSQEGALVYRPNAGVRVNSPVTNNERTLLMGLRKQIELAALPAYLRNRTEADDRILREILARMRQACRDKDLPAIAGSDIALHQHIVRRGVSEQVEAVWTSIAVRIRMDYSRISRHLDIYREHERIIEAVEAGDEARACEALISNLI
jgi:DNA-binding GntR family transcriptional regulator